MAFPSSLYLRENKVQICDMVLNRSSEWGRNGRNDHYGLDVHIFAKILSTMLLHTERVQKLWLFGPALAWEMIRPGQKPCQAKILAWLWPWYQSQKAMAFWPEAKARTSLAARTATPLENTFAMVRKKMDFTVTLEGVFASFPGITARLTVKLLPNNATTSRTSSFFYLYTVSPRKWINFGKGGEANWTFHVESVDHQKKLNVTLSNFDSSKYTSPRVDTGAVTPFRMNFARQAVNEIMGNSLMGTDM
ncbi:hypothetical protein B0H14DRAFT_2578795 [Mycena olivaceomarginata]|nr:hypothetical protein B0H14DRAFT_2578795 [Mycena olivaceomarginata]